MTTRRLSATTSTSIACLLALAAFLPCLAGAAVIPDETGHGAIEVAVRGAAGGVFRPGFPTVLEISIRNASDAFSGSVRVRETRQGGEAAWSSAQVVLPRGISSIRLLAAPSGPGAGATVEVGRADTGETVFRGDLWRAFRPLADAERLALYFGVEAFPPLDGFRVERLSVRDLPVDALAYSSADLVVIERASREDVTSAQAEALAGYVGRGGDVAFASFRAIDPFERRMGAPPRETPPPVAGEWTRFRRGLGEVFVAAAEPGDRDLWAARLGDLNKLFGRSVSRAEETRLIDAGATGRLGVERPFARSAERALTVAVVGALLATVLAAVLAGRKRAVLAAAVACVLVSWSAFVLANWRSPEAAVRGVTVRVMGEGAEFVSETLILRIAEGNLVFPAVATERPNLPVARTRGELLAMPYVMSERANGWTVEGLLPGRDGGAALRTGFVRDLSEESRRDWTAVLARGRRAGVVELSGGLRRVDAADGGTLSDAERYLIERFAPSGGMVAWRWSGSDALPRGVTVARAVVAPGGGEMMIALMPGGQ